MLVNSLCHAQADPVVAPLDLVEVFAPGQADVFGKGVHGEVRGADYLLQPLPVRGVVRFRSCALLRKAV